MSLMVSQQNSEESTKRKRRAVRTTVELKKELIAKFESGMRVSKLALMYGMPKSTVSSILKNRDAIKRANVAKGVTVLAVNRSPVIDEIEKLLLAWFKEKQLAGEPVPERLIYEKAKELHTKLRGNIPGTSSQLDEFKASRGWFDRFKKRSGIRNVRGRRRKGVPDERLDEGDGQEPSSEDEKEEDVWGEVSFRTLNCPWEDLRPDSAPLISPGDIKKEPKDEGNLDEDYDPEERMEPLVQPKQELMEVVVDGDDDPNGISSEEIKKLLYFWEKIQAIVEKWHPDIVLAKRSIKHFEENIIEYFREILRNRQTRQC